MPELITAPHNRGEGDHGEWPCLYAVAPAGWTRDQAWDPDRAIETCDLPATHFVNEDGQPEEGDGEYSIYCRNHAIVMAWGLLQEAPPAPAEPVKMSVSLTHKMGLPDYSSVEASLWINFTSEHTAAEVDAMVERGKLAWDVMGPAVTARVRAARAKAGW